MKKISEKVALIAQICLTFIFVILTVLIVTGVIKITESWYENNTFVVVIMIIFAVAYIGLSAYMVFMHFSETSVLKQVLLYSYSDSAVKANAGVVRRIAKNAGKLVEGVKLNNVQIRPDEKYGLKMRVLVSINASNAEFCIDKLRAVLADSFKNVLGIKFSAIDFKIVKMKSEYKPDLDKANELALNLEKERKEKESVEVSAVKPAPSAEKSEELSAEIEKETLSTEDDVLEIKDDIAKQDFSEFSGENADENVRRNIKY